ncbi:M48 family metalloprotease [Dysgonomonas macrotermitis]|uniref:Putative metalloprotease n=1 Tax=Dysgonomonas macrotermitis TaxID=1346286 RepID=A0A1M5CLD7_9BACT|nr:M48 family metalloprotease [Dysgonomonas macrotermitis]SHF55595.1 putative metalloprotease [Dysgonomonas macrotermitis]
MKKFILALSFIAVCSFGAHAQFGSKIKTGKLTDAATKAAKSFTISDAEINEYCNEYIQWMDTHNPLCKTDDKSAGRKACAQRLAGIVSNVPSNYVQQYNLDIQPYYVIDVNAFACANGSIRVFAALMDEMTDDQVLGVICHEIGHVVNKDSKDAFVTALRVSALKDAAGSVSGSTAAKLTDSQLGDLAESMSNAQFSQKQESAADAFGFELLKQMGKDPSNMASALGVLLKLQEEAGSAEQSKYQKLFSSHPDLKKRIENLNKKK